MKKVVVLNGSPRKNFNTALMLKEAQKGAESAGAEVEYFNLYDYKFTGCVSCLACKRTNAATNGLCAVKDDIREVLEKCINADAIIIGSPVYFSNPTGVFRCFFERLLYPNFMYMLDKENGGLKRRLERTIPTGVIFTMNLPEEGAKSSGYDVTLGGNVSIMNHVMGYAEALYAYDTMQFDDYSKYDCDIFDPNQKIQSRETKFPADLKKAFELGKKLATMN